MINQEPLVSICMITYGHEKYIQQSIESILMQQTSFDFELIIANDCSPDNTEKVIRELLENHPKASCIKYFSHAENMGMYKNFLFALNACKSKYMALCEGDDYWVDPLKLQKQIDFLETNPEYELCFTNIKIINDSNEVVKEQLMPNYRKAIYEHENLPIWAPTLTRVFRNRDFSNAIPDVPGLDTIMLLYQSKFGKIKLINEVTGVYRLHDGGVYSSQSIAARKEAIIITFFESFKLIDISLFPKYFGLLFKKLLELKSIDKMLFKKYRKLLYNLFKEHSKQVHFIAKLKIVIGFIILFLPLSKPHKFLLRIIDKMFIYS